jgi:hypothetical protein
MKPNLNMVKTNLEMMKTNLNMMKPNLDIKPNGSQSINNVAN